MKTLLSLLIAMSFFIANAQKLTYAQFQQEAKINKRLLPKYGQLSKSDDEKAADIAFIEKSKKQHKTLKQASKSMVMSGYQALQKDPREAMFCFNQAYLLDSTNADIYWGYGQLYYHFKEYELAKQFYEEGLALNPKSTMLLNSSGLNCIEMYKNDGDQSHLDGCIKQLQSSFMIDPTKAETSWILTKVFLEQQNCEKAKKYFRVYLATEKTEEDFELMERMENECELSQ